MQRAAKESSSSSSSSFSSESSNRKDSEFKYSNLIIGDGVPEKVDAAMQVDDPAKKIFEVSMSNLCTSTVKEGELTKED